MLGLLALEVWGAPTSKPAYDPANRNFIYQRFQRGIMHYDKACGCTQGLLLADYLKALLTGEGLPADLATQAASSPLLCARDAAAGARRHRVRQRLRDRRSGAAPGEPSDAAAAAAAEPGADLPATGDVPTPPRPVSSPDYGMSMFLWGQPSTTERDLKIASGVNFHWQKTLFQWATSRRNGKGCFDWSEADRVVKASKQGWHQDHRAARLPAGLGAQGRRAQRPARQLPGLLRTSSRRSRRATGPVRPSARSTPSRSGTS